MADNSKIEWTDATWNPITGCKVVSPGCTNCYAMRLAGGRLRNHPSRAGLTDHSKAGAVWNGQVRFNADWLDQPMRWKRPRRVFVCAHGDLFYEAVPDAWIDRVFEVMAQSRNHVFQVLTKRADRMRDYVLARLGGEPLPNIWLGVSVEDQARANERIPALVQTPAAVRWLSAEPLLGPVDLNRVWATKSGAYCWDCLRTHFDPSAAGCGPIDWVVAGGESGPGSRSMLPAWPRALRDQCARAGVPFFFKQWGQWSPTVDGALTPIMERGDKRANGRTLDGRTHDEMPAHG